MSEVRKRAWRIDSDSRIRLDSDGTAVAGRSVPHPLRRRCVFFAKVRSPATQSMGTPLHPFDLDDASSLSANDGASARAEDDRACHKQEQ